MIKALASLGGWAPKEWPIKRDERHDRDSSVKKNEAGVLEEILQVPGIKKLGAEVCNWDKKRRIGRGWFDKFNCGQAPRKGCGWAQDR